MNHAPSPVERAVQGWMDSADHRRNILGRDFTETGAGVCSAGDRHYLTQVFLRPAD